MISALLLAVVALWHFVGADGERVERALATEAEEQSLSFDRVADAVGQQWDEQTSRWKYLAMNEPYSTVAVAVRCEVVEIAVGGADMDFR